MELSKKKTYFRKYYLNNREKIIKRSGEYSRKNRDRVNLKRRERRKKYPELVTNSDLKRRFGIILDDYNQLLYKQESRCAICLIKQDNRRFSVDHDHKTGKVRGLLCSTCNMGLGCLQDDAELLRKLATYIEQHRES